MVDSAVAMEATVDLAVDSAESVVDTVESVAATAEGMR